MPPERCAEDPETESKFDLEFPDWTSAACIIRFSCHRNNEFEARAGRSETEGFRWLILAFWGALSDFPIRFEDCGTAVEHEGETAVGPRFAGEGVVFAVHGLVEEVGVITA
jgi:hypothetical protein